MGYLGGAVVHVDPLDEAEEARHGVESHAHDGLAVHSHQAG